MTEPPPPPREFRPDLHPHLEGVILKALAKEPEKRYPSGMALVNALDRALKIAAPAPPDLPPPTLSHLSIPEHVRANQPLPPELVETQAAPRFQSRENGQSHIAPAPVASPAADPKWSVIG
jgi:serine/threonine-protein kinase